MFVHRLHIRHSRVLVITITMALAGYFLMSMTPTWEPTTKVELGEHLFFDPILSRDSTLSCASCHKPAFAFADTVAFSTGIDGQLTERNTPSAMNMSARSGFFFDGRVKTLSELIFHPIANPIEMGANAGLVVNRVASSRLYKKWFKNIYGGKPDSAFIADAITEFVLTLNTSHTDFDRWMNDDEPGLNESQIRGRFLFMDKGKCFDCHFSPDFTGDEFRNIGLYDGKQFRDVGRFKITGDSSDLGKFKVPGLRNISMTAPYMHNGMFKTLKEVVDYYNNPSKFVENPINMDTLLHQPLHLSETEVNDLVHFLESLTDDRFKKK